MGEVRVVRRVGAPARTLLTVGRCSVLAMHLNVAGIGYSGVGWFDRPAELLQAWSS